MATASRKKKKVKVTPEGTVHIKASFNNVMVTITDTLGNTVSWSSAGKNGFKGSKKNTPYASQVTSEAAAKEAYDLGMRYVDVLIKGPGSGRDAAIRALQGVGLEVRSIRDITPLPHNGCRPPKRRRV
ncbi:MAG TPA: 30S ribosomal protein S11 [Chlorobaculum sp.]|jgi:small subunit ribosomal protein S11|uniref:Small ribosomal subunit protein uS11 n=1 Tax=Chlorobaculum tepidum (strain ATCC 49652 / DSM 12025 / NBRC 103806 / TLS) TaxID=194439 RepID=RS11_CHLTE|nr:30S ribosomal protein S11 [Chlorobaculum tepidum]Q8KAJ6.1 RecName: Full=Small ribosomal subunit protein uS11; AltName: Full=30S ribosomal protein S11 [Chlorobaculum tepidum TLS]AAM73380.1 ribosomal protein S11 [Chlorobaculum tepidum TLS]HBU23240.1 30S ribosomal protein S11 [Chlorobaculum sp.]